MKTTAINTLILLLFSLVTVAQETIDANDPASYVFGGGQGTNSATIQLLNVSLIDLEPEGSGVLVFGGAQGGMEEAGLPAGGIGGLTNKETWINYSFRGPNATMAQIKAVCNQSLPNGMSISVEIIGLGVGSNFGGQPIAGSITLSTFPQTIINNIPAGFTEDGINQGFQLEYSIANPNNESLPAGFEIIFTIE